MLRVVKNVSKYLRNTLFDLFSKKNGGFRVILGGSEMPEYPENPPKTAKNAQKISKITDFWNRFESKALFFTLLADRDNALKLLGYFLAVFKQIW